MSARRIEVTERPEVPADAIVLGFGPVLMFPLAALVVWLAPPDLARPAAETVRVVGGTLLCFLGGVRRGLSFRTEGGPRPRQVAVTIWLYALGLAVVLLPGLPGLALLPLGFLSVFLLDPGAAQRGEVPLHFARLRLPQMTIALAGQLAVLAGAVAVGP